MKGDVAGSVRCHVLCAEVGLTLAKRAGITGCVGEELQPEGGVHRAVEGAVNDGAALVDLGEDREVLEIVASRVAVAGVVRCDPVAVEINTFTRIGMNDIAEQCIAGIEAAKADTITTVVGNRIASSRGSPTDCIVVGAVESYSITGIAERNCTCDIRTYVISLYQVSRGAIIRKHAVPIITRNDVSLSGSRATERITAAG